MARIEYGNALGDFGLISDFLNPNALSPVEQTTTVDRYEDPEGDGMAFVGTGLTYNGLLPTGGTVTNIDVYSATDAPLVTITQLNVSLAQLYQTFSLAGLEAAFFLLTMGDDLMLGSRNSDYMLGGEGNDTMKGNDGADVLSGFTGRDVLTGGGAADEFIYAKGDGRDKITDFSDRDRASDDQIGVTQRMYDRMVVTETDTGVTLTFGAKDVLTVLGWHAVDVGLEDFLIM